jgi:hypothetical protein
MRLAPGHLLILAKPGTLKWELWSPPGPTNQKVAQPEYSYPLTQSGRVLPIEYGARVASSPGEDSANEVLFTSSCGLVKMRERWLVSWLYQSAWANRSVMAECWVQ